MSARTTSLSLAAPVVAVLLVLAGCGTDASTDDVVGGEGVTATATPSPEPAEPSEPTGPSEPTEPTDPPPSPPVEPELITYAGGEAAGITVHSRDDVQQLRGAPRSFKRFVADTAATIVAGASCEGDFVGVTVDAVRTDGFASGGVNECGGYAALWAQVDGRWQEIQGTQDSWDCAVLEQYAFPSELLLGNDTCFDAGDQHGHTYEHA